MAIGSLPPRNHRSGVVRSRSGNARLQPAKHLRLWEAIRQTRAELEQWRLRAEHVENLFRQHVLPREKHLTAAYGELTDRLMDRYDEGRLSNASQALLALWIADNLRTLETHPFMTDSLRSTLTQRWQNMQTAEAASADGIPAHAGNSVSRKPADAFDEDELEENDVIFDFGWHGKTTPAHETRSRETFDRHTPDESAKTGSTDKSDDQEDAWTAAGEPPNVDDRVLALEKRLSVDRLFRQLAGVLHPDREQDEKLKSAKHELMSQCLTARQNKDINTLLTLYCEHVGELPDDLATNDHDDLIAALQLQLRQLQYELRQQRFSDPLRVQIVERYSTVDEQRTLQRVLHHARSLDEEVDQLRALKLNLDSDDALHEALEARRKIELDRMAIDQMTGYT